MTEHDPAAFPAAHRHLVTAEEALAHAATLTSYPGSISTCRGRLGCLLLLGGWDQCLLSADVIREIAVVRRALVRERRQQPDIVAHVGDAIRELDAALACFGLCALTLHEATYLQSIYSSRVGDPA